MFTLEEHNQLLFSPNTTEEFLQFWRINLFHLQDNSSPEYFKNNFKNMLLCLQEIVQHYDVQSKNDNHTSNKCYELTISGDLTQRFKDISSKITSNLSVITPDIEDFISTINLGIVKERGSFVSIQNIVDYVQNDYFNKKILLDDYKLPDFYIWTIINKNPSPNLSAKQTLIQEKYKSIVHNFFNNKSNIQNLASIDNLNGFYPSREKINSYLKRNHLYTNLFEYLKLCIDNAISSIKNNNFTEAYDHYSSKKLVLENYDEQKITNSFKSIQSQVSTSPIYIQLYYFYSFSPITITQIDTKILFEDLVTSTKSSVDDLLFGSGLSNPITHKFTTYKPELIFSFIINHYPERIEDFLQLQHEFFFDNQKNIEHIHNLYLSAQEKFSDFQRICTHLDKFSFLHLNKQTKRLFFLTSLLNITDISTLYLNTEQIFEKTLEDNKDIGDIFAYRLIRNQQFFSNTDIKNFIDESNSNKTLPKIPIPFLLTMLNHLELKENKTLEDYEISFICYSSLISKTSKINLDIFESPQLLSNNISFYIDKFITQMDDKTAEYFTQNLIDISKKMQANIEKYTYFQDTRYSYNNSSSNIELLFETSTIIFIKSHQNDTQNYEFNFDNFTSFLEKHLLERKLSKKTTLSSPKIKF